MEQQTFQRAMAYLAAAYSTEISAEKAAVYWDQLSGMRDDRVMAVCRAVVGADARFPTVARLREVYQDELRRERLRPVPRLERPEPDPEQRARILRLVRGLREALR